MKNEDLKQKYDEMHKQGASAWFSDGREERETILKMGEPWKSLRVLEIGCGEGDLFDMIKGQTVSSCAIDYSEEAISKARQKYPGYDICKVDYRTFGKYTHGFNRLVMQGVIEHLDDPFTELQWMMDNLLGEHGDMITSSPCFLNPRGIVWMTLDMLGAVMSKTDLHFLNPWDFEIYCKEHGYGLYYRYCDVPWGWNNPMIEDLKQRIPLALKDGGLPCNQAKIDRFITWLNKCDLNNQMGYDGEPIGATMVYRITK